MSPFTVVLPAYNEEGGIGIVLDAIRSVVPDAEVIVVDDGSTDGTAAIVSVKGAMVISHRLNLGAGRSVKDGIERASNDSIVMLDADATYPVASIPTLIAELDRGYNLIVGARQGKEYRGRILKRIARFIFRMLAQFATGKHIPDINSGMRAFRKSEITPYFGSLCDGFSLPTTMTLAYFFTGKKVQYVPISYAKRIGQSKVRIVRDSLRTLQFMTESIAHFNPLKLFLLFSIISLVIGGVSTNWVGWWGMVVGVFFAVLMLAVGVGAESIRARS